MSSQREAFERVFPVPEMLKYIPESDSYGLVNGWRGGEDERDFYNGQWEGWQAAQQRAGKVEPKTTESAMDSEGLDIGGQPTLLKAGVVYVIDGSGVNKSLKADTQQEAQPMLEVVPIDKLKEICTSFFYWWYNQPGQNTQQGFDEWIESDEVKALLVSLSLQPDNGD